MADNGRRNQRIFIAAMVILALLLAGMTIVSTMQTFSEKDAAATTTAPAN